MRLAPEKAQKNSRWRPQTGNTYNSDCLQPINEIIFLKKPKGFYLKSIKRPMTDDQTLKEQKLHCYDRPSN
jgi:hypothetical protein